MFMLTYKVPDIDTIGYFLIYGKVFFEDVLTIKKLSFLSINCKSFSMR